MFQIGCGFMKNRLCSLILRIWEELDNAYLNKVIWYKNTYFKVIKINKNSQVRYS